MQRSETKELCPRCHTAPDATTGRCDCPAPSDSANRPAASDFGSGSLVAQAESLFENYLAARLVRARRQLTAAKVALLRDPRNRSKLEELRRAEQETERLQAQLVEQARKAAQARERAREEPAPVTAAEPAGTLSAQPTETFRAVQAAIAEEVCDAASLGPQRSRPDDRECPQCGSRVPGEQTVCACGHRFVAASSGVVAEPFLTEEELAALRNAGKSS